MNHDDSPNADLVIGVDGGGTKTVAWVAPRADATNEIVLGRGQAGPSNPRAMGFEAAQRAIDEAVTLALQDAGRPLEKVAAAWLGVAGAGRESEQKQLEAWALGAGALAHRVRASGDAEPILSAGGGESWGIALVAGTGSLAWGRNRQGEIARAGGCGHLIGDEGSAYAIAIAALRTAMQSADGRRPSTRLLEHTLHYFNATSPANLIEIIYAPEMTRDCIAGCAQGVFSLSNDAAAAAIIDQAAYDLAAMIAALARQLQFLSGAYPLSFAGSLLLNQAEFRQSVVAQLESMSMTPKAVRFVTHPVRGTVALARQLAANPI